MKRILLDTNIYGEMVMDPEIEEIRNIITKTKNIVIYGNDIIRKELRSVSKKVKIPNGHAIKIATKKLRISLLGLYDEAVKKSYDTNQKVISLADHYYETYCEVGGSKSKSKIINDFRIVACATLHDLDIIVSEDDKTMSTENSIKAHKIVNSVLKKRDPGFIDYLKFKKVLRSG